MTCCEDTLTASVTTHDYLVTTQNDITDDPCGNIDDVERITCLCLSHFWDQMMTRTTRRWQWWLMTLSNDVVNLVWWSMWLLPMTPHGLGDKKIQPWWPWQQRLTTLDNQCDDLLKTLKIFLTTSDDSIWRIYIVRVKSCLSCWAKSKTLRTHIGVLLWQWRIPQ
jgi:hypothetical protein